MEEMIVPESFAYESYGGRFILGSAEYGSIYSVYENGTTVTLSEPIMAGLGCSGAFIDTTRNLFWTNMINYTAISGYFWYGEPLAGAWPNLLFGYDLTTGDLVHNITLQVTGYAYANDVTMDSMGNMYVTDSTETKVWKVDADLKVSVFVNFSGEVPSGQVELNGMRAHDGSLFVWTYSGNCVLYKINLTDATWVRVPIVNRNITLVDGIEFAANGDMYVSSNSRENVLVRSTDKWKTANVIATFEAAVGKDPAYSSQAFVIVAGVPYVLSINWYTTDPNYIQPAIWTYLATNSTNSITTSSFGSSFTMSTFTFSTEMDSSSSFIVCGITSIFALILSL